MKKIFLIAVLAFVAGFSASQANATMVTATSVSTTGVVLVATPTVSGTYTYLKGCQFCNDTATATCVQISDNLISGGNTGTYKFAICAAAYTCTQSPNKVVDNPYSISSGLGGFFGEEISFAGAITVTSETANSKGVSGVTLSCAYIVK